MQWNASPPRLRLEDAVLQVASGARDEWQAIGVLTDACGTRRTTAERLLATVESLTRIHRRAPLARVLADLDTGACSVLEQAYLRLVERPHGLPAAQRQVSLRSDRGREYRDVEYERYGLVVELDGHRFHRSARQRDLDLDRDLDAAAAGAASVRLGWARCWGGRAGRPGGGPECSRREAGQAAHPCGIECRLSRP